MTSSVPTFFSSRYVEAAANTFDSHTQLLYIPRPEYFGEDLFRIRSRIRNTGATQLMRPDSTGGVEDYAEVLLHVHECRVRHCEIVVETLVCQDDYIPDDCMVDDDMAPRFVLVCCFSFTLTC